MTGSDDAGLDFFGDTGSAFQPMELSISNLDGSPDARPTSSSARTTTGSRATARTSTTSACCAAAHAYDDTIAPDDAVSGGSYTAIAGTSMASPHVAGVAALVRAVDPGAPPTQVVAGAAERREARRRHGRRDRDRGVADAVGAMDAALALPNPQPGPPPPPPPQPQPPAKPRVGNVRWGTRRGVLSMLVRGGPDMTGTATLKANITAARVRVRGPQGLRHRRDPPDDGQDQAPEARAEAAQAQAQAAPDHPGGRAQRGRAARRHERHDHACGSAADNPDTSVSRLVPLPTLATRDYIEAVRSRVVVFDGGMGATLEQFDLTQEDYGGLAGQVPRGARPEPPRRDPGRARVDAERGRRGRRDRHLPGQSPEARGVGARRAHARDQHEGRADRPRGRGRGPLRGRLDRPDRPPARERRPDPREDHLPRARRGLHRAGAGPDRGRRRPARSSRPRRTSSRSRQRSSARARPSRPPGARCRSRRASRSSRTAARCSSAPTSRPC